MRVDEKPIALVNFLVAAQALRPLQQLNNATSTFHDKGTAL